MLIYVKYKNNKINAHAPTTQLKNYRFIVLKKNRNYCEFTSSGFFVPQKNDAKKETPGV